jgi:hypothetical protein
MLLSIDIDVTEKDIHTNQEIGHHSGLFPQSQDCNTD